MSTRTKEEIKQEIMAYRRRVEQDNANVARLEAELAALPVEPVELVALWVNGEGDHRVHPRGLSDWEWLATIDGMVCTRHGIDPAALARFITTFTYLPRLMELRMDSNGCARALVGEEIEEVQTLARRYHDAMNRGAA